MTARPLGAGGKLSEARRQCVQDVWGEPVPGELAILSGGDSACLAEDPQMVAHRRLLGTGLVDQVTGAALLGGEQLHDPEAERVGQQGEDGGALTADVDGCDCHGTIRSHQQRFISG